MVSNPSNIGIILFNYNVFLRAILWLVRWPVSAVVHVGMFLRYTYVSGFGVIAFYSLCMCLWFVFLLIQFFEQFILFLKHKQILRGLRYKLSWFVKERWNQKKNGNEIFSNNKKRNNLVLCNNFNYSMCTGWNFITHAAQVDVHRRRSIVDHNNFNRLNYLTEYYIIYTVDIL